MSRSIEEFELLNTASQLRRAADHVFAFYRGAISREECRRVVDESHDLLGKAARVKHHLVPLAEAWSIERLRRMAVLDRRFTATTPEVLFVDKRDATVAPLAAALLAGYARGRVHVSSAGVAPAEGVDPAVRRALADIGLPRRACPRWAAAGTPPTPRSARTTAALRHQVKRHDRKPQRPATTRRTP